MKISVFKDDDEGYANYLAYRPIMVYVNGELLSNWTRLDTEAGWVQYSLKSDDGLFIIEGGEIVSDVAEGLVEVTGIGLPIEQPEPDPIPEESEDE
jgi:hypothetical protein